MGSRPRPGGCGAAGRARPRRIARASRACWRPFIRRTIPTDFPLSGTEAGVEQLDRADLAAFHSRSLVSARPTVIVAGDVDPDATRDASSSAGSTPWTGSASRDLRSAGDRAIARGRDCSCSTGPVPPRPSFAPVTSGSARSSPDFDHVLVVNQILGGQFTSRLEREPARRARADLRRAQLVRLPQAAGPVHGQRIGPDRKGRRGARANPDRAGGHRRQPAAASRGARRCPPVADRGAPPPLRHARRAREPIRRPGDSRSAGGSRRQVSPTGWPRSTSTRCAAAASRHIVAGALVAVVVADASRVLDQLKSLGLGSGRGRGERERRSKNSRRIVPGVLAWRECDSYNGRNSECTPLAFNFATT